MVFFSQFPRRGGGFPPRTRQRYGNGYPNRSPENTLFPQMQPRRQNYPYYPPNQFRRQESPFFIPNQYRQQQPEEPYYDPYFDQQQYPPQGGLFGQPSNLNHLMGHVGALSNGMNMISQIGSMMGMFRGF